MLMTYALFTAGVVAVILRQLRSDTIASSHHTLTAFAQLTAEQTTRTFQNVEDVLEGVESQFTATPFTTTESPGELNGKLGRLTSGRPFLRAIAVLDRNGHKVFSTEGGRPGLDLSDRAYFRESRDNPNMHFRIAAPVRGRTTNEWVLPATLSLRDFQGEFTGVLVASINPHFFDRVWTVEKTIKGQATALWTSEGVMVMRSPFVERAMGETSFSPELMRQTQGGADGGSFDIVSVVDGKRRLAAYHRLSVFPGFIITVTQATEVALAPWRHIAWLASAAWAVSLAALSALSAWLIIQWNAHRAEQGRYQTLFDANAYPMAVMDRDTFRFLAVNDAAIQQYGWSREETLSMSARDLYFPEDIQQQGIFRPEGGSDRAQSLKGHRHRTKDGTVIDVELQSRPIQFGKARANLVVTQNVTGRIRAEQERIVAEERLRQSQERYRMLFEAAPYAVVVYDRETRRLLAANDAATKLYGWTQHEMIGMAIDDFYLPEDRPKVARRRLDFTADVTRLLQGVRQRRRDGTLIFVEIAVRFINYQNRPSALAIVSDISERLRLEESREVTEAQLRQAQKMEVVGQLTGGVAHDFNNLLTVILANADEVQEEAGLEPRVKARLEQIAKAVLRASELTGQLLAFSRKQALNPRPTNLNDLVRTTGKLLRRTLGEHVEFVVDLADDLWLVNIDRAQLETALINLCVNARDASPDGGKLVIQSRNDHYDPRSDSATSEVQAGDFVRLSVTDTGTGMPPEVLAKVFEPFFTTKDVGKGSGLGLSMVYGFITQSGGTLKIDSEIGHGTTVTLHLPRSAERAEAVAFAEGPALPRGNERILVVEDASQVRINVVKQLRSLGYHVSEAADGASAVAALEAATRPYDLLLTDVVMPGTVNGQMLAEVVARRWPGIVVTFMSGHAQGVLAGGDQAHIDILLKPFRKHGLAQFVRRALDARAHVPQSSSPRNG